MRASFARPRSIDLLVALGLILAGPAVYAAQVQAVVSIAPHKTFVQRIGGDRVDVTVLVEPGQSPATYEPKPRQMTALSNADVYLRIGVPFERSLMPKIQGFTERVRIVDLREGIRLRRLGAAHEHAGEHAHGHEEHASGGEDPHTWLSPKLAMLQAATIYDALARIDPEGEKTYRANLRGFLADLADLHGRLTEALRPVRGKTFLVFHPAWGYFADAYGLEQRAVEFEGKEPSARHLAQIIDRARREDVRVIFVQPQFSQSSARAVAREIGGAVVAIDPLAEDYIANLERVAKQVSSALGEQR